MWNLFRRLRRRNQVYGLFGSLGDHGEWLVPEANRRWRRSTDGLSIVRRDVIDDGAPERGLPRPVSPLVVTLYSLGDSTRKGEQEKILLLAVVSLLQQGKDSDGQESLQEYEIVRTIAPFPRGESVWDSTVVHLLQQLLGHKDDWFVFVWIDAGTRDLFYATGLAREYAVSMGLHFKLV